MRPVACWQSPTGRVLFNPKRFPLSRAALGPAAAPGPPAGGRGFLGRCDDRASRGEQLGAIEIPVGAVRVELAAERLPQRGLVHLPRAEAEGHLPRGQRRSFLVVLLGDDHVRLSRIAALGLGLAPRLGSFFWQPPPPFSSAARSSWRQSMNPSRAYPRPPQRPSRRPAGVPRPAAQLSHAQSRRPRRHRRRPRAEASAAGPLLLARPRWPPLLHDRPPPRPPRLPSRSPRH
mmetsp:Transcript_14484/g.60432  ORF Transcript_14484/g.60432 Transcript_14484/m.60432 type:complete len:232 (-) Transcript_14484:2099-2794(-)